MVELFLELLLWEDVVEGFCCSGVVVKGCCCGRVLLWKAIVVAVVCF